MIVAAFAGTGKSYFASLHPDCAIDLVCMPYKYILDNEIPFDEKSKGNGGLEINGEWPFNYIEAVKQCPSDKIILIPSEGRVLRLLDKEHIPYLLCYPTPESKEEYTQRYINRGNSEEFLSIFIGGWDIFMGNLRENKYGGHAILQPDQFLTDALNIQQLLQR